MRFLHGMLLVATSMACLSSEPPAEPPEGAAKAELAVDCAGYPAWNASTIYKAGDRVVYQNSLYEALVSIWTADPVFGTASGWYKLVGACGTGEVDTQPPSSPAGLRSTAVTASTVSLAWDASTDNVGVTGYDVFVAGGATVAATETSVVVGGLSASTAYTFTVKAKDAAGNLSGVSAALPVTTSNGGGEPGGCRPDGLYPTPGVSVPYCQVYDSAGREKMGADHPRRLIGYFTGWRHGKNGQPAYLVSQIPWGNLTHINYAFAHVDAQNRVSVGANTANNPSTGMQWPGVPGAEMDPAYSYKGHFNLLNKYKKQYPNVKTLVSIGGWAESGGYLDDNGNRVASGGFYTLTTTANNTVNTAAINTFADSVVAFLRTYGFDGADIDFEYATSMPNAGNPDDFAIATPRRAGLVRGYVALMKTLREKLDAASAADGKYYLLTAATTASGWILRGTDTYQVTPYLDFANLMTYDLHGAWNEFVGPNAALYDDGKDGELLHWNVYGTYGGIGYLNTDWAYHYFRGALQAGRINLGVPYYTRGWQNVTGGTNGLWGKAPLPDQTKCPPGTGSSVGSTVPCGNGALGIDNLWHDKNSLGAEVASGSNPLWHARNLQEGRQGSYLMAYGLDPVNDPTDRITGTYARNYSAALASPWLWNATKKVFLSTEDEESLGVKAQYVVDRGIGGLMFWELAGDYAFDPSRANGQGEYFMGHTLTRLLYEKFKTATPYRNVRANQGMPTDTLDVTVELVDYALGDSNYPISPTLRLTNNSGQAIPGGALLQFDYGTSTPATLAQQSGWTLSLVRSDHSGSNLGGLKGDFHRVQLTVPTWQGIPNGSTATVKLTYQLPIASPSNYTLAFGGKTYGLKQNHAR
ncbi:chitinase [Myxococcus llanfairpwllgwyngyllgogerychwyrndrobwllllantysiliogogogochensis]|uniref:Chitinase n=1 Tax=Myxococcus llanfairpwllgwyngyllgogerychwyrndrobwllllantysiliogogogochensis TaxID=2590453 RepID=A0A540WXH8_9BACT|nr:glycosyl hydrolase family 18 protein [Myxococcus llanfairpwllgwyngyllgogerychwyrndrobwllllantysiliogogogochensis]TQF13701.1 chitinase [Myxococcus llanfairpwllgwyngyllgogerychwyrndrobwllllantysiliogogogochensis]